IGRTSFPAIGDAAYPLTLGAHAFYWLSLEPAQAPADVASGASRSLDELPLLPVIRDWEEIFKDLPRSPLARLLPWYLRQRRWFGGKARDIGRIQIIDSIPIDTADGRARLTLLQVHYAQGEPEVYLLPVAVCQGSDGEALLAEFPGAGIARFRSEQGVEELLFDAVASPSFARAALQAIAENRTFRGAHGELTARAAPEFRPFEE